MKTKSYLNMNDAEQKAEALRLSDRVVEITIDDAGKLVGMAAPIVSGQLKFRGWAPLRMGGINTLYTLKA